MTTKKRTNRIATRMVDSGYRVTGHPKTFKCHTAAFNAAWRTCAKNGADLYGITPDGQWILSLRAKAIQAYERDRRRCSIAAGA